MPPQQPPRPLTPPALPDTLRPGETATADPGLWPDGAALTLAWLRDGDEIPGATAAAYRPGDDDDGRALALRVRAAWPDGTRAVATSAAAVVRRPAPVVRPLVLDETFDPFTGDQPVPTAQAFAGDGLTFAVERDADAPPARIDPATGLARISTDRTGEGEIAVVARNSGGTARLPFRVVVESEAVPAALQTTDEIAHDGVRIRFDRPVRWGRFISSVDGWGDPYVVGPATVVGWSPTPVERGGRRMNGAMVDPGCQVAAGFDSLDPDVYRGKLDASRRLPVRLEPGQSLVIAVSNPRARKVQESIDRFVVLTSVAEVPPDDAFRPPYTGPDRRIRRLAELDLTRLARLDAVPGMPRPDRLAEALKRPSIDFVPKWDRKHILAAGHVPLYGRDLCAALADPFVITNSAIETQWKLPLVIALVQQGIDRWGILKDAERRDEKLWSADGAHNSGRKFPIMYAGHLLGDDAMRRVPIPLGRKIHEDAQSFIVDAETVAYTHSPKWKPRWRGKRPQQPYDEGMIGIPEWRLTGGLSQVTAAFDGAPYRLAGNANAQHGQVLSALAMGLRGAWGHDPYFAYHMRHVAIVTGRGDPWRVRGGRTMYPPVVGTTDGFEDWHVQWKQPWAFAMFRRHVDRFI